MNNEILTILVSALIAFLVAWATVRAEESKGRAALYALCCRFFIAAFNAIDTQTGKIKTSQLDKERYVQELESILSALEAFSSNPLFIKFVSRNELAPAMLVQVRSEMVEHRQTQTEQFALNRGSVQFFLDAFDWCKKMPWGVWLSRHKRMNELAAYLRQWMEGHQQGVPVPTTKPCG